MLNRLADTISPRCTVPDDLASVTVLGDEDHSDEIAEAIWTKVEGLYRTGMHPGIQVCIRHEGKVVVDRAIGHARGNRPGRRFDPSQAVPMSVDTPVNLFSAAKAITAMAMHKLEEQGTLSLDDRVVDHVPEFGRHGKGNITVRQLLTHRAGIPSLPPEAFDLDLLADHDSVLEMLCELRPASEPGGSPAYHAVTGGFVADAVARRAAGRGVRDVLNVDIKQPLGATWLDFGVAADDTHRVAHNIITGVPLLPPLSTLMRRTLGREWAEIVLLSNDPRFLSGVIPSGNVIVTARDVATFYQCLLDGGRHGDGRVFQEETVRQAIRPDRDDVEFDGTLGMPMRYGTGFMLGTTGFSLYGWNHPQIFGHVGLSNQFTWADPERDLVVAILTTGKPVLGTHLLALPQLIAGIHEVFPARN